ncbi:MAG: O-antigen ligase family protein [Marinobacter sp.]|nr:O-antigen ligase family protein [Marinobacter sp.]
MSKIALLFLMVFTGGVVATFLYSGASAFFVYQLVYFLNPDSRWWAAQVPGLSYSFIAAVLMLIALAVKYRHYSELSPWREQPIFKWAIGIVVLYYLVGFIAMLPGVHYRFAFNYLKLVVIIMVAYKLVNSRKLLDFALWAYVIGATYIGYLATSYGRSTGGRVEGIGMADAPDANDTAAALVPAGAILLYFFWMGSKKVKLACVVCGAFIANGLVLINSRGAFLGIVSSAGLYLLYMTFSKYRRKGQRAIAIFTVVLGISGGLYVTDDTFWERMSTLQSVEDQQTSGSSRVNYWLAALDMSVEYPLGMGVGGFNTMARFYVPREYLSGTMYKSVHSMWMQGLTEVGWLGLIFLLAMLFSLWRLSRKAKKWLLEQGENSDYFKLLALECALFGYLVAGSFINRFRAEILYWMIVLLAIGINVYFLQRAKKNQKGASA